MQLHQLCQLQIPFSKRFGEGSATVQMGDAQYHVAVTSDNYDFGVLSPSLEIAALEDAVDTKIDVILDDQHLSTTHKFTPAKRWKVFLCPKIHNDVGFTDIQPHVNELDTRNTDTVLSILDKFPEKELICAALQ